MVRVDRLLKQLEAFSPGTAGRFSLLRSDGTTGTGCIDYQIENLSPNRPFYQPQVKNHVGLVVNAGRICTAALAVTFANTFSLGEYPMNRITAILVLGAVFAIPAFANADCGCGCDAPAATACCDNGCGCESACNSCCDTCNTGCNDCCTRTRLRLVRVCKPVCRSKRVCTTDCCGCSRMTRVRVTKCVPRLRLVRVEVPKRCGCCKTQCCDPCNSCQNDCCCN